MRGGGRWERRGKLGASESVFGHGWFYLGYNKSEPRANEPTSWEHAWRHVSKAAEREEGILQEDTTPCSLMTWVTHTVG